MIHKDHLGGDIQKNMALKKLGKIRDLEKENGVLRLKAQESQKLFRSHSQTLDVKRKVLYDDIQRLLE